MKLKFNMLRSATLVAAACLCVSQVSAQSYLSPGYLLGEIRDGLGIVKPEPAPDFVVRGRPEHSTLEYIPLKPPPRDFHAIENTPGARIEAKAGTISELEAARANAQARAAGLPAPKAQSKSPAAPPEEDPAPMKWNAWDTE